MSHELKICDGCWGYFCSVNEKKLCEICENKKRKDKNFKTMESMCPRDKLCLR